MVVFESQPGAVVRLSDASVQAQARLINFARTDPDAITYDAQRSIITSVEFSGQVNLQFMHTLGNLIYVYVFGDRLGAAAVSGLSFGAPCENFDAENENPASYGPELLYTWYRNNRASTRATPVKLLLGARTTLEAFVVGYRECVVDAASSLMQWSVALALLPNNDSVIDTSPPDGGGNTPAGTGFVPPPVLPGSVGGP